MPAPRGNKFAAKPIVKGPPFGVRLSKKARAVMEKMLEAQKLSASELIEKLILEEGKRNFDKKLKNNA